MRKPWYLVSAAAGPGSRGLPCSTGVVGNEGGQGDDVGEGVLRTGRRGDDGFSIEGVPDGETQVSGGMACDC